MKKFLVTMGFMFIFFGCSVKTVPPPVEYTLYTTTQIEKPKDSTCKEKNLKIFEPFGSLEYTASDMYYMILPYEEDRFSQSSWAQSISSMIYAAVVDALRDADLFKGILNYTSLSQGDQILEMEINDFKQYFSHDEKSSYVISDITFTLVDSGNLGVIAQKRIKRQISSKTLDAKGGVKALNTAFAQTLQEMVSWMKRSCQ